MCNFKMFSTKAGKFFTSLVKDNIKIREEQGIVRLDMIQLLMEAKKGSLNKEEEIKVDTGLSTAKENYFDKIQNSKKLEITEEDIIAQALIFFFAGFDSVSTLMCFMAYELAVNPDIQKRLRHEVLSTYQECNGNLTYEVLMKMKYMDMVVSETLRKWPNSIATDRYSIKPYTVYPETPEEKLLKLPDKSVIWIPIFGIHRDPKFYPEPDRFDPERFNDENKDSIKPYTYLPFGVGPRNCIGSRFALLETKIIMFHLLLKMDINVVDKTPIPMKLRKKQFNFQADPGFYLELKRETK